MEEDFDKAIRLRPDEQSGINEFATLAINFNLKFTRDLPDDALNVEYNANRTLNFSKLDDCLAGRSLQSVFDMEKQGHCTRDPKY